MKTTCPKCGEKTKLTSNVAEQEIVVRGDPIVVSVTTLRCDNCGEEFYDINEEEDPLALAYEEYRRKNSLIQPHQIREIRSRYGLSQRDLSSLLGWGGATISRYENGALQDLAHDKMLHLIQDPKNLLHLLEENPAAISESKQGKLSLSLKQAIEVSQGKIKNCFDEILGTYNPDHLSGNRRLAIENIINAILFFCSGEGVLKTKLNKLLFYADFLNYKEYSKSITGARYIHLAYGPILDNYEFYLATMIHEASSLRVEEKEFGPYLGELLISNRPPEIGEFEDSEVKTLALVKEHFNALTASEISNRSHQEKGYKETKDLDYISYEYADAIEI
jgi:putative zinc finger/helix-turn-helix YgiT family protein